LALALLSFFEMFVFGTTALLVDISVLFSFSGRINDLSSPPFDSHDFMLLVPASVNNSPWVCSIFSRHRRLQEALNTRAGSEENLLKSSSELDLFAFVPLQLGQNFLS
jgi:hypothetical protein